jgi:hypothetical protein
VSGIGRFAVLEIELQLDYIPTDDHDAGPIPVLWSRGRSVAPTTTGSALQSADQGPLLAFRGAGVAALPVNPHPLTRSALAPGARPSVTIAISFMGDSAFYGFHVNPSRDKCPIMIPPAIDGGGLETNMSETKPEIAGQRDRSPSFPFIPLRVAVARLLKFEEHHKRSPVPPDRIGAAWGMKPNSSQAQQTLAALKAFGLLETRRATDGRYVYISEDGRTYLRAQQDSIKSDVLRRAGLRPKQIAIHWKDWGDDRPSHAVCRDELVLKGEFSEDGAEKFLRVYDETIAFAKLADSDKVPPTDDVRTGDEDEDDLPPAPIVKVGDYVQWTSGGIDQFKQPRCVVGFFDEHHAQVFASNMAIPVTELTVVDQPGASAPTVLPAKLDKSALGRAAAQVENDFTILQRGNRLQITADVDLEGIATLKAMLDDYESILRRLSGKK